MIDRPVEADRERRTARVNRGICCRDGFQDVDALRPRFGKLVAGCSQLMGRDESGTLAGFRSAAEQLTQLAQLEGRFGFFEQWD